VLADPNTSHSKPVQQSKPANNGFQLDESKVSLKLVVGFLFMHWRFFGLGCLVGICTQSTENYSFGQMV
jgi:hypothetical protein